MEQNTPNPFDKTTQISYYVPDRIMDPIKILVTDLTKSKIYFSFDVQKNIPSVITVDAGNLITGVYIYSIFAEGKILKSKKMMVIK